ncbi:MAG: hypothetical protein ABI477_10250 [Chryseolinea sp.]
MTSPASIVRNILFTGVLFMIVSCQQRQVTSSILILATAAEFGLYTSEILKTEGFNTFVTDSLSKGTISLKFLKGFDIIILAETNVTSDQQEMLTYYVKDGGNLIAFRPDRKLQSIFGLKGNSSTVSSGYIAINNQSNIGKGLINQKLQFHGLADVYTLAGATQIARLFSLDTASTSPAAVWNNYGKGHALAFTYNLPKSIVYTRQGNPDDAAIERDGILGLRAMDLFTHGFVDNTKNILNQADEQMRLLTHGIEQMSLHTKPIPRFWYFPDSLKCVVTLNNDGEDSREAEFLEQFNDVEQHGGLMTLYVKEVNFISKKQINSWIKRGFEISGHPNDTRQAAHPDWKTMDSVYHKLQDQFKESFGIPSMQTITNHWFVWVGKNSDGSPNFAAQAKIEEQYGIGLDCNYAHYDNGSDQGHFLGEMGINQGNYTGSGLTMKFANSNGQIIDVYQQLNNVYDQQYMEHKDQDGYFNAFKGLMDRSIQNEVYSSISVRAHNNEYFFSKVPLMKMLDYSKEHNVPVWTELSWLEFLRAKDEATFQEIRWSGDRLTFSIYSSLSFNRALGCLIPYRYNKMKLAHASKNGQPIPFSIVKIKGVEYARILVKPGSNHTIEAAFIAE